MTAPALCLLRGRTVHRRYAPFDRRFDYGLTMIDLDIDRLDQAAAASPLFAVDRPGLYSFRRRDHGARQDAPLRPWAEAQFAEAGVDLERGAVRLATFPRHLFYRFAPLSLWFGHGPDGRLRGVIYEVCNTFGESHAYVAATDGRARHEAEKRFHVSPFFDVSGRYRFTLRPLGRRLDLTVENLDGERRVHTATIAARRAPATTKGLAAAAAAAPFSSLGVTLGIHWEALQLWRRGARYRAKPQPPRERATPARRVASPTVDNALEYK